MPGWIKDLSNSQAYQPQVVSLGPIHSGNHKLRPMEVHKLRAVMNMVWRTEKPLEQFIEAVREVAPLLESAYGQDLSWLGPYPYYTPYYGEQYRSHFQDRGRFMEMMVRDGCFFLEVMRLNEAMDAQRAAKVTTSDPNVAGQIPKEMATFDPNDTVFSEHGFVYLFRPIQTDMLLMENQLPYYFSRRFNPWPMDLRYACPHKNHKISSLAPQGLADSYEFWSLACISLLFILITSISVCQKVDH